MGILEICIHAFGAALGVCTGVKHGKALVDAGKKALRERRTEETNMEETENTTEEE